MNEYLLTQILLIGHEMREAIRPEDDSTCLRLRWDAIMNQCRKAETDPAEKERMEAKASWIKAAEDYPLDGRAHK